MKIVDIKSQDMTNSLAGTRMSSDIPTIIVKNNGKLDRLGVWLASLCALHCLLLPILIPLAPLIASSFVADAWFERVILSGSILVGFAALFIGFYQYHRQLYPIYSLVLGALIYWNKHMFGEAYEPVTIAVGALLIIIAHVTNLRLCKKCKTCETC
ncbi:hypothetical protein GPUN_2646 [Glaciecola punicea ACAM 611]|uniref:MerC-like membrane protein n=2 Tax=Glaciecola TaxID=89404 RepID=H5TEN3_9ALTE|nr:hypothetical protein GPUN_2646 [Glaciecola punicea ACAM 611]